MDGEQTQEDRELEDTEYEIMGWYKMSCNTCQGHSPGCTECSYKGYVWYPPLSEWKNLGTATGRLSSKGHNMANVQNIPRMRFAR